MNPRQHFGRRMVTLAIAVLCLTVQTACTPYVPTSGSTQAEDRAFTIAMIPDTQNYVDYQNQKAENFAINGAELYIQQMQWVASRARANGGAIDFVASVGDTWQHSTLSIDPEHEAMGIRRADNPLLDALFKPVPKAVEIEISKAVEGYQLIAQAGIPFGVPPGNHDYDALYTLADYPPNLGKPSSEITPDDYGVIHFGGLTNFVSAFGRDSAFFAGKPWYVDSFRGGTSSAQIFTAGGLQFLHLALEMQPGDEVIAWAVAAMAKYPRLPTIVSTHDYLDPAAQRSTHRAFDATLAEPVHHNTTQQLFEKLVASNDQIFLVLSGHYAGQALRVDNNAAGHKVYQILADYQDRGQVALDAGQPPAEPTGRHWGLGDGWLRLLEFELGGTAPTLTVRTYSTYYGKYSSEMPDYARWYREHEQPTMTDDEFLAAEEYTLELDDFGARFGLAD